MSNITISGLSPEDVKICDLLWSCDTDSEVQNLIAMMPAAMGDRALVLKELLIAHELDTYMEVSDELHSYLCSR
jgi:hypothetical protein